MTNKEIIKDFLLGIKWAIVTIFENPEEHYFDWFLEEVKSARKNPYYWFFNFYLPFEDAYQQSKQRREKKHEHTNNKCI